jgi:hypothetical protein
MSPDSEEPIQPDCNVKSIGSKVKALTHQGRTEVKEDQFNSVTKTIF